MSFKYFRFYLANSDFLKEEAALEFQSIFNDSNAAGFIRASLDLISPEKSISILCESDEDVTTEQGKWAKFLFDKQIYISETTECEVLKVEERSKPKCMHDNDCDHTHHDHHEHHHEHHGNHENHWLKAAFGITSGLGLLILSLVSFNIPMLTYYIITGLSSLMTLYLGHRVYQSAWRALNQNKWSMATLYTISTLSVVGISIAGLFVPGLPMMIESAPLILGFWHLGEAIEHTLLEKINEKLDVRDCAPESVLLKCATDKYVSVKQLIPNDIIVVKGGDVIPIDGVLNKPALLYTTRVDGSPNLKQFAPGDAVKAGMTLATHIHALEMRVTKTYQQSYLSLIAKNIKKANDEKAPIELVANQILKYFVPGLLLVAILSGSVIGVLFTPALAIQCVISILVSACPCALSLITPMAVRIGMKKASENGIHFKSGKALQAAADIDIVVFDLNGTLTQGEIIVNRLHILDETLLKYFALLEAQSEHPAAKTITSYIKQQGITIDESLVINHVDKSHHSGIKGVINGETFMIGNKDMLLANGINSIDAPFNNVKNGTVYMVRGSKVAGQIALTDPLRKDAIATVKQLQAMGKEVHICTGADKATAERYAELLGISSPEHICANAVGATTTAEVSKESHIEKLQRQKHSVAAEVSKESYIEKLQRQKHSVAMVGDAANDLTAIARADLGIAVKSSIGNTVTEQHAGMIVQLGLLFPIATAFDVAVKTKQNIFQNLFVSLTYNSMITLAASGLFIGLGFTLNPAVGVALMVLESAIVFANLYRLKQQETIFHPSNNKNGLISEQPAEQSATTILSSLGYQPQATLNPMQAPLEEESPERPVVYSSAGKQPAFFSTPNNRDTAPNNGADLKQPLVII